MEPLGERPGGERGGVDTVDRRVEGHLDGERVGHAAPGGRALVETAGQPVGPHRGRVEPGATSAAGRPAKSPSVVSPRRRSSPTSSARAVAPGTSAPAVSGSTPGSISSSVTGRGARKAGEPPGGTITLRRAARAAANTPSATPTWHSTRVRPATWSTRRSATTSSLPK